MPTAGCPDLAFETWENPYQTVTIRQNEKLEEKPMSLLDSLRKGLDFLLLSFGVSTPTRKPRPASTPIATQTSKTQSDKPGTDKP